jgi:hypothetical protein
MQYLSSEQGLNTMWRLCNSVIQTRRHRDKLHVLGPHIAEDMTRCFRIDFVTESNLLLFCYTDVTTFVEDNIRT